MAKKPFDPVLNIKNELANLDSRNFSFYRDLDDDRKKRAASAYPVMRWLSVLKRDDPGLSEFYISAVNQIANIGFWDLHRHPEIQWQLMACCGVGTSLTHDWIALSKAKSYAKLDSLILKVNPSLNSQEVSLVRSKLTKEKIKEICYSFGWEDSEIKPYYQDLKKYQDSHKEA